MLRPHVSTHGQRIHILQRTIQNDKIRSMFYPLSLCLFPRIGALHFTLKHRRMSIYYSPFPHLGRIQSQIMTLSLRASPPSTETYDTTLTVFSAVKCIEPTPLLTWGDPKKCGSRVINESDPFSPKDILYIRAHL